MSNIKLAIIYGGQSPEHEISVMSARNVIDAVPQEKYGVTEVFISPKGDWSINANSIEPRTELKKFDVVFPVLHGQNGEDGTIQGLLQLIGVPFVGSDVLGSSIAIDKDVTKRLCLQAGISVAPGIVVRKGDSVDMKKLEIDFSYPLFVKPACTGSSIGVHKVNNRDELAVAITDAFLYDTKILIEAAIDGQEIETAVLGNENPKASFPGIVRPKGHSFYTYESKYFDDNGYELEIPAQLPDDVITRVQDIAIKVFKACECRGLARIDCFVTETGQVILNEINTMPGFTHTSMYPKLCEASGTSYPDLIDTLIQLAIERHQRDSPLKTTW
ncbi:MAG: D-alanine--D-alanine ligase [Candidatus Pacebacteria bacterium]|nr:D-alanine--D-alanine ligase [Candidatus Paceibacterota bacterium]